jgi:hypothetical protein
MDESHLGEEMPNLKIPNTIFWLGQNKSFPCDGTRVNECQWC